MEQPFCYCGNPTRFNKNKKCWGEYCSPKCANSSPKSIEKRKQTNILRYGVDNPAKNKQVSDRARATIQKRTPEQQESINTLRKNTVLEKYGVEYIGQREESKKKSISTNMKKYGVGNPAKNMDIQSKIEKTNLERYGTKAPAQNSTIKDKIEKTNLERYGYSTNLITPTFMVAQRIAQKKEFYESLLSGNRLQGQVIPLFSFEEYSPDREKYHEYPWKCCKCDKAFNTYLENGLIPRCPVCFPFLSSGQSKLEIELREELVLLGLRITVRNNKIVPGVELDIFLPDHRVAIEFNGIYWHSESVRKDKMFHLNKTIECNSHGVDLIHIFEWDWLSKKDIILSIISSRCGINPNRVYARNTTIDIVNKKEERIFLEKHHIQGYVSSSLCLGLYTEDRRLIQVASFGKSRYTKKYQWELLRSCTLMGLSVVGGLSKLLTNFSQRKNPTSVISYCDRSLFNGRGYVSSGFSQIESSNPSYVYTKHHKTVESRFGYQKHLLSKKLKTFDPNLTEWENMQANGYDRIWDCGNLVYVWVPKSNQYIP